MKKIITISLAASFLCFASCWIVTAQAPVAQSDEITDDGSQEIIQDDSSTTGKFEPVEVDAGATSDVRLQFPVSMASKAVAIEPLDGGTVTSDQITPSIEADGSLSFSVQVTTEAGIHRVIVIDPNADEDSPHTISMVQFEVPAPPE